MTADDDETRIAEIRQRAEAATEGPWWGGGDRGRQGGASPYGLVGRLSDRGTGNAIAVLSGSGMDRVADAEFIAAAREDIPWLLADRDALLDRLRATEAERDADRATWLQQVTALGESVIAAEARAAEAVTTLADRKASDREDLTPCTEEKHSWDYFTPEQVDSYWMRCDKTGPHDEHENSETGAHWMPETEQAGVDR